MLLHWFWVSDVYGSQEIASIGRDEHYLHWWWWSLTIRTNAEFSYVLNRRGEALSGQALNIVRWIKKDVGRSVLVYNRLNCYAREQLIKIRVHRHFAALIIICSG